MKNTFADFIPHARIERFALNNLAKLINRYLKLDRDSQSRLEKLQNRIITIELMPLHFIFQLLFTENGVEIKEGGELPAETIVRGTPLQMFHMVLSRDDRNKFFADDIEIEGNADLGQQVIELFDEVNIDWEEQLAKITGDVPSYHISQFARGVKGWLFKTATTLKDDIRDYLHEETLWLPSKEHLTEFYQEIDTLRMDVDRLYARFLHLERQLSFDDEEKK